MANLQSQIDILAKAVVNEHVERIKDQSNKLTGEVNFANVYNQNLDAIIESNRQKTQDYKDLEQSTVSKYNGNEEQIKIYSSLEDSTSQKFIGFAFENGTKNYFISTTGEIFQIGKKIIDQIGFASKLDLTQEIAEHEIIYIDKYTGGGQGIISFNFIDDGLEISGYIDTDTEPPFKLEINNKNYLNSFSSQYGHFIYKINNSNKDDMSDVKWLHVDESKRSKSNPLINAYNDTLLELSITGTGDLIEGLITYSSDKVIMNNFTKLTEINVLDGIAKLTTDSFKNTTSLKNVILPNTLLNIDANVFENCVSLTHIELPSSLTEINVNSFKDCTNLEVISYSTELTSLTKLTEIDAPNTYFDNDYDINVLELRDTSTTSIDDLKITETKVYNQIKDELGKNKITIKNEDTTIEDIEIMPLEIVKKELIPKTDFSLGKEVIYLSHGNKIIDWFKYNNTKINFEYDFIKKIFSAISFDKDSNYHTVITNNNSTINITETKYNELNYNDTIYTITHHVSVVSKTSKNRYDQNIKIFNYGTDIVKFYIAELNSNKYLVICSENTIYLMYKLGTTNNFEQSETDLIKKIQCAYKDNFGNIYRKYIDNINITCKDGIINNFNITVNGNKFETSLVSVNNDSSNELTFKIFQDKYIITNGSNLILWMYVRNTNTINPVLFDNLSDYVDNNVIPISRVIIENNAMIPNYGNNYNNNTIEICSLKLPNSLTSLTNYDLKYCRSLSSIELPTYNFKSLSNQIFMDCQSLTSVELPSTLTSLGIGSTFCQCRNLQTVIIPSSITEFNGNNFIYCDSLSSVTMFGQILKVDGDGRSMFMHHTWDNSKDEYKKELHIYLKHNYYNMTEDKFKNEVIYTNLNVGPYFPCYIFHLPNGNIYIKQYEPTN